MIGLQKYLTEEAERLRKIKQVVDKRLINTPEGNLRITTSGKHAQYMHCMKDNGIYKKQGKYLKHLLKRPMIRK